MSKENKVLVLQGVYKCSGCLSIKSLEEFPIKESTRRKHRHCSKCNDCERKRRANIAERQRANPKWYCRKLVAQIKHRSKVLNVPFDITADVLFNLWTSQEGLCYYTKQPMNFLAHTDNRRNPHIDYPSIDRKDPKKGYVSDNLCWCKWAINRMKNDLTEEQFRSFCQIISW